MPFYRYRAASAEGRIVKGQIEALHEADLDAQLSQLGLSLLRAEGLARHQRSNLRRLPTREIINFLFQLEMLMRAGVPILTALGDMRDDAEDHAGHDHNIAGKLYDKIEAGSTLVGAMTAYPGAFPDMVINLIRSGEITGQLPDVLHEIVRSLKWQDEITAQTKRLLIYPAFLLLVICGVVFFLMTYLVPQLVGFLTTMGEETPPQTLALIWASGVFVDYWWAILAGPPLVFMALLAMARMNPSLRYRLHRMQLGLPWIGGVFRKMLMARFADSFALMYRTGIPLLEGLQHCQNNAGNLVIQAAIGRARERIANGGAISASFAAEKLFPPLLIRMLKVGESTGAVDASLNNISYFYTRDITESVGRAQAMIEPTMTIIMGLLMGWIMMAVLSPIYDTISRIQP